jgi:hypothetical protein
MKQLYRDVIAKVQQTIMKRYGHFTKDSYVLDKKIPTTVASLIRKLGKWLVALES